MSHRGGCMGGQQNPPVDKYIDEMDLWNSPELFEQSHTQLCDDSKSYTQFQLRNRGNLYSGLSKEEHLKLAAKVKQMQKQQVFRGRGRGRGHIY